MKNHITVLMFVFLFGNGISQNKNFEYKGRNSGAVTKEKLSQAKFLREITPQFERYFFLPKAHKELLLILKKMDYAQDYLYPDENYNNVMEYLSVTVIAKIGGQTYSAEGTSDIITKEQIDILRRVDQDGNIQIRIKFRFKNPNAYKLHVGSEIMEGYYYVAVVPETEAQYPGGFGMLSSYLTANVFDRLSALELKNMQRSVVKFIINENGKTSKIMVSESCGMPRVDRLITEAIQKMPRWTPAKNKKGLNITQAFTIPFIDGC